MEHHLVQGVVVVVEGVGHHQDQVVVVEGVGHHRGQGEGVDLQYRHQLEL